VASAPGCRNRPGSALSMLRAYARAVTRHAVLILVVTLALTVFALSRIVDFATLQPKLLLDTSIEQMLPSDDEDVRYYQQARKIFGSDETLLLVVRRADGILDPELLATLSRLTARLERVEGVDRVLSLANAPNVRSANGELEVAPLYSEPPRDAAELARIRHDLIDNPLLRNTLFSKDETTTALVIPLLDMPEQQFTRVEPLDWLPGWLAKAIGARENEIAQQGVDKQIERIAAKELGDGVEHWLVGGAHIKAETTRYLLRDLMTVIPLAFLLIIVVAALSFRSVRGVVIPVATIAISVIWTIAVMAMTVPALNLVTVGVPSLLLVIGFAYGVHIVACYNDAIEEGPSPDGASAAQRGLETVLLPTFLTGGSTVAGFLSLVTNPLSAIREFGLYGGLGVGFAALAAITFSPAVLQLLPEPSPRGRGHAEENPSPGRFDRLLLWLGEFDCRNATRIFAAIIVLVVLGLAGIPRIIVNSTMITNFPEDSSVRLAVDAVNEHLGGAGQINIVFESDSPNAFQEPTNLATLDQLHKWLAEQPTITSTTSIVDYVKLIHRGFNDNAPDQYRIPASKNLVSQLLFFGGSDEVKHFVDSRGQRANMIVRTTSIDSGDLSKLVRRVEEHLKELPNHIRARVTGNIVLIAKTNDSIALGQALSVGSAFLSIFAIMVGMFMSIRIAIIAMIPNIFPVFMYFGVLGWTGITLNVTTGLVAQIVLGIAVDDTVHFLTNFNRFARKYGSELEGVKATLLHVARPVTTTTVALILGFGVLGLSSLNQQAEFGNLAGITLFFAWLTDVIFTPAICSRVKIVTLWDALSLDLGQDPQKAIPLFHGFSKWQARIVALMTQIVERKQGERLLQTGQKSDGMYLTIEGQLQSSIERDGALVPLNRHGRGDVLGEVGLFRGERTANVDCETDCRLLRFDQENLSRLQRRYPRTAAKLMRNLSEVLADRLKAATARVR
jgi:predicted RND superfamily exporter protein